MSVIQPLPPETVEEKRTKLAKLLREMSVQYISDESEMRRCADILSDIYSSGYRQMYSEIYPIIFEIYLVADDENGLEFLTNNLEGLRAYIGKNCTENDEVLNYRLYGSILKLSDHVNLEKQRLLESNDLFSKIDNLRNDSKVLMRTVNKSRSKIRRMQTETVVILGIFAAIVMAFSGGMTILATSAEGLTSANPYKLAFIVLLCGIVLFNTVAYLLHRIDTMVSNLYEDRTRRWIPIREVISKNRYTVVFNVVLLLMLAINLFLWYFSGTPIA